MNGLITISLGSGLLQRQAVALHSNPFRTAKTLFKTNKVERHGTPARLTTLLLGASAQSLSKAKVERSISPFPPMARRGSNYQARQKGVGEQMKFWGSFGSVRPNQPTVCRLLGGNPLAQETVRLVLHSRNPVIASRNAGSTHTLVA